MEIVRTRFLDQVVHEHEIELAFSDSINSQLTFASTVLIWLATSRDQSGFMYARLEALELFSFAARARNGLPSTIN
jgi:hypothetical protein